jgi:hypothetical protein
LRADLAELLKGHGVSISRITCNMIGTSRSAACELRLSSEQVALLIKGLNLKELKGEDQPEENLRIKIPHPKDGCLACPNFKEVHHTRVYMSGARPPELRLKSGSAFEHFILFQDLQSDKVCIQVSYAYG